MLRLAGEKEKFSMVTLEVAGPPGLPGPVGFDPLLLLLQLSEPAKAAIPKSWMSFIRPPYELDRSRAEQSGNAIT
jgi:hypothetical protein